MSGSFDGIAGAMLPPPPPGEVQPEVPQLDPRILGGEVVPLEDGGVEIILGDDPGVDLASLPWGANLAEHLDPSTLAAIASDVLDGIAADQDSNEAYFADVEQIIKLLALQPEDRGVDEKLFPEASDTGHPMLLEAVVRFVSNARAEMLPADGPARTRTFGTPTQLFEDKAQRRARFLNWHLTVGDAGYYRDAEAAYLWLAIYGSVFKKTFRDPVTGEVRSRYLTPADLLVSYHAPSLEEAQRATHIDRITEAEAKRRQLSGYYRSDVALGAHYGADAAETPGAKAQAVGDLRRASDRAEDAEQVHYHCHCWLTLDGTPFAHMGEDGAEDGLPLPFIVTVDEATRQVLRIERDWDERDPHCRRRKRYVHMLFHPGLGFPGWGLGTLMRSSTEQASALWRVGVDTFSLNAFPGGFRMKGLRNEDTAITVGPGEFPEIETNGRPVRDAIMSMGEVYKPLPPAWQPLFQSAVEQGQRLGMTTELQVGEGRQDAPVGSTLALIEQAARPMAAVFKRLHAAMAEELRLLCAEFAADPEAVYPFVVDGQPMQALAADFADANDVVPVSDPNQPTQVQRLALAQATMALAGQSNGLLDMRAALVDVLRVVGKTPQEIQALMPQPQAGQPADVVTEFAKALKGMPLAVGPMQDHMAHAKAHIGQMKTPGLPPPILQALLAHVGDHVAAWYALQAQQAMQAQGIPMPPPGQPMPPEMEGMVAQAVAAQADAIAAELAQALGGAGMGDPLKAQELAFKEKELAFKAQDSERKAEAQARQEQGEMLRAKIDAKQAEEDRASKERLAALRAMGDAAKGAARGLA